MVKYIALESLCEDLENEYLSCRIFNKMILEYIINKILNYKYIFQLLSSFYKNLLSL